MLLVNLCYVLTLSRQTENIDTVVSDFSDTLVVLKGAVVSHIMTQKKTRKFVKKVSKHLGKIFDLIENYYSDFILDKAINKIYKTDENIKNIYKMMSVDDIQIKISQLNNLLSEGDELVIGHFRSISGQVLNEGEEDRWNIWKDFNRKYEKEVGIKNRYHAKNFNDINEIYDILDTIQDNIDAYLTILSYKRMKTMRESLIDKDEVVCCNED